MIDQETFTWFAAIDWGTERHQACVLDARGGIAGERAFSHSGAGLALLCDWILSIAGSATVVAVAVEVPHGPVVDSLLDRGMAVHAINPKQLDRLRDRFCVSGAKDDRRDAYVAADGLRTDRHLFRRLHVADPRLVELREELWHGDKGHSGHFVLDLERLPGGVRIACVLHRLPIRDVR